MKLYKIVFSPTGGTEKVADAISKMWSDVETLDHSDAGHDYNISLNEEALALIAMPSFGGLAPQACPGSACTD